MTVTSFVNWHVDPLRSMKTKNKRQKSPQFASQRKLKTGYTSKYHNNNVYSENLS